MKHAFLCAAIFAGGSAAAEVPADLARAEILPGWRAAGETHIAALRLTLAPGWKTYWRAPGDAGIPPRFVWDGSRNVVAVEPDWPVPHVFYQNGMRSVGYAGEVILPLAVRIGDGAADARLSGTLEIGICEDVCVPVTLSVSADLSAPGASDPAISTALDKRPMAAENAGVTRVVCGIEPISDGIRLTAAISMPRIGAQETAVIELSDPSVWVSEADVSRTGGTLTAVADMVPPNGSPFLVDRSAVRITVIAGTSGVDIRGCTGG